MNFEECVICHKCFKYFSALDRHMKNVHGEGQPQQIDLKQQNAFKIEEEEQKKKTKVNSQDEEVKVDVYLQHQEEAVEVEDSDNEETKMSELKVKNAPYTMDDGKILKRMKDNLERNTYEIKVEQTPKGGATNITMNPAPFLLLLKHMEVVRPGQKSRIGKVTATVKENMELRESKNKKVHTKIVMEMQLNQSPASRTKPTIHLFPGDSKIEIQGSNAAQERAANEYFVPLLKKLLKGNEVVVEKIQSAIVATKEKPKKRKPKDVTLDCSMCECKFMTESDLRVHRAKIHGIVHLVSPTASPPCKKDKPNENKIYITGKNLEDFPCEICAVMCETKYGLDDHMKEHQNFEFECGICAAMYKTKLQFDSHLMEHQNFEFECQICAGMYRTKHELDGHMKEHQNFREKVQLTNALSQKGEQPLINTMEIEEASEIESNNDDKSKPDENTIVRATETEPHQTNDEGNTEPEENT